MSCPPNMLCINYSYTIVFIIIIGLFLFYLYTKYQHIFIENSQLKQNVNQK